MRAYASHSLKVFNVQTLDLKKVAKSFGFETPPWVGKYHQNRLENSWLTICSDIDVAGKKQKGKQEGRRERQSKKKHLKN